MFCYDFRNQENGMEFEINNIYHGFKLLEEKEIKELNGIGRIFQHEKSGARLFFLKNDDDNKVFSISFRTPPKDSTGVPHILEHSVLCGSRKFPTKEPFVELIKGSLNTFLNAMTFPDKTMYPVASRNEKDFINLVDVYLDAVLYPNLYNTPEILMQEGWHYEIENKEEPLTYKGVVYNEMQGAFSSPEGVLMRKIQESLFEDTIYSNESGGDPEFIPDLTQEAFVGFHKKYYHPSNSYIFLYGDSNIDQLLAFINDNYLKDFDKIKVESAIDMQKPYDAMKELQEEYPISTEDNEIDKTFLSLNFVVGDARDAEEHLAMEILEYMLLENPAAPLKKALVDAELGKDVFGSYDSSIIQPNFSIIVKNSNIDKKEQFKEVVFNTLNELVEKGIDKKLIEACINITEFKLREADLGGYPKGLLYCMSIMESWLYDGDPYVHIQYDKTIEKIRIALKTNYFESLIQKYLLNNTHSSMLVLKPKKGLAEEKSKKVQKKLEDYKNTLSEKELQDIIKETEKLKERQNTPDTEEVLETIPLLSIEDIDKKAEDIPQEIKDKGDVKILYNDIFTSKILYTNLIFDCSSVEEELIPYISLLSNVLGKLSTEKHHYSELSNEININTGGIYFSAEAFVDDMDYNIYHRKFMVKSKALTEKTPELINLLTEIIGETKFDEDNRLKELIQQMKSRIEMKILERGHSFAASRVMSYFSPAGDYMDKLGGLQFYKFITDIEKNFKDKAEDIKINLQKVVAIIFNKNNLILSITGEEEQYNAFMQSCDKVLDKLSKQKLKSVKYNFKQEPKNEGLLTPANVQYVAKGYNFNDLGYKYSGNMLVLKTITSLDYLWNKVRVQGGAYGCFANITRGGNVVFASYRDPNLKQTLKVYDNTYEYIEKFDASEREMTKYIIGTISDLDAPLTPSMKGERSAINYIRGIKYEDIQREREQVLSTKVEDVRSLAKLYKEVMNKGFYCVLGNENEINANKDLFNKLVVVFE